MAHKKGVGSSKNGRESASQRLGVKIWGGQFCKAGNIIVRQRGTVHHPGENIGMGSDHTLFALVDGTVVFKRGAKDRSYVSVLPVVNDDAPLQQEAPAKVETAPVEEEVAPAVEEVTAPVKKTAKRTKKAEEEA